MKRHIHTILTASLTLVLGTIASGQDSRGTKSRPTAHPPKHPNVVKPKEIPPAVPKAAGEAMIPGSKPFVGGFAGNPGGGLGFGGGFAGNPGGGLRLGGGLGLGGYGIGGGIAGNGIAGGYGSLGYRTSLYNQGPYRSGGNSSGSVSGDSLGPFKSNLSAGDRRRILGQQYRDRGAPPYGTLKQYYGDYERMLDKPLFQVPEGLKVLGAVCPPLNEVLKTLDFFDYGWKLAELALGETISGHKVDRAVLALRLATDVGVDPVFDAVAKPWTGLTKPLTDNGLGTVSDLAKYFLSQEAKNRAAQGAEGLLGTLKKE